MKLTVDRMESRLDDIVAETLRRRRRQLDLEGASTERRAAAMAKTSAEMVTWRRKATGDVLRAAVR